MSVAHRILSAAAASWVGILLGFGQRLIVVPIILSKWDISHFGAYLALLAAVGLFGIPGRSYETVVGRECLRLGPDKPRALTGLFGGAVFVSLFVELIMLAVALVVLRAGGGAVLIRTGLSPASLVAVAVAVFLARTLNAFPGVIFSQVLSCYGCYPRTSWLGLVGQILSVVLPIVAVLLGFGVATVVTVEILAPVPFAPIAWYWLRRWARQHGVWHWGVDAREAFRIWKLSLQNLGIFALDMIRQEGLRLMLAPLAGMTALSAFATIRTGANVAMQGLSTITGPIRPELMRFLGQRDQARSEAAFGLVWMSIVALMAPAVIVLQVGIEPLFNIWTRGAVHFDPLLFASLSVGVLVYAAAQPALAVVTGNNLLGSQVGVSALAGLTVIGGMFALVPHLGIVGAGFALLAAELLAAAGYRFIARRWLIANGMKWPEGPSAIANTSVWIAAAAMGLVVMAPAAKWITLVVALGSMIWNMVRYWQALPKVATQRVRTMLAGLMGVRQPSS